MFTNCKRTKARTVPGPNFLVQEEKQDAVSKQWSNNVSPVSFTGGGTQITESDGNPWPPPKGSPLSDRGSEFFSQKTEWVSPKLPYTVVNYVEPGFATKLRTRGNLFIANPFVVNPSGSPTSYDGVAKRPLEVAFPPDLSSSRSALNVKGAIAIASCNPGNPIAQVATALGELFQDVPKIPGVALWESRLRAIAAAGAVGSEFLNYLFGIKPTLGDMGDFLKGVHSIDRLLTQFERDAGGVVRRGFTFPKERTVTEDVLPTTFSPAGTIRTPRTDSGFDPTTGVARNEFTPSYGISHPAFETLRTRITEREIWFSGAFTYHLPLGYDTHSRKDRLELMEQLFGASPDISTLWALTPWSWAADWIFDTGSVLKNLQSKVNYGTVLRYGYVMEKTTTTDILTAGKRVSLTTKSDVASGIPAPYPAISPVILRRTTKKRIQANPFGFGVSWDGLSTIQQAIVAALGISRVAR